MSERSGRILGLDYGSKTVGVAVCDPLRVTVRGLEIIRRKDETHLRPTLRRIAELAREYDVDAVVLGLPLNMDDSEGLRAQKTLEFRKMLESRLSVPVIMQDERLSSAEAEERMRAAGIGSREQKELVDQVAASVILEDYLGGI